MSFPGLDFYNKSMVFVREVFEDDPCLSLHTGVLSEAHQSPNRQHLNEKKYQVLHCINTAYCQVKLLQNVKMFLYKVNKMYKSNNIIYNLWKSSHDKESKDGG